MVAGTPEGRWRRTRGPRSSCAGSGVARRRRGRSRPSTTWPRTVAALAGLPAPVSPGESRTRRARHRGAAAGRPDPGPPHLPPGLGRCRPAAAYGSPEELPPAPGHGRGGGRVPGADGAAGRAPTREAWLKEGALDRLPYLGPGLLLVLLYLLGRLPQPLRRRGVPGTPDLPGALPRPVLRPGGSVRPRGGRPGRPVDPRGAAVRARGRRGRSAGGLRGRLRASRAGTTGSPRYVAAAGLHAALSCAALLALPVGGVRAAGRLGVSRGPAAGRPLGLVLRHRPAGDGHRRPGARLGLATVQAARFARHRWPPPEVGDPEINADRVVRMKALRRRQEARLRPPLSRSPHADQAAAPGQGGRAFAPRAARGCPPTRTRKPSVRTVTVPCRSVRQTSAPARLAAGRARRRGDGRRGCRCLRR